MKRRLTSVLLAFCFAFSSAGFVYAADSDTDVQEETETTTEETTEEETETTTESAETTTSAGGMTDGDSGGDRPSGSDDEKTDTYADDDTDINNVDGEKEDDEPNSDEGTGIEPITEEDGSVLQITENPAESEYTYELPTEVVTNSDGTSVILPKTGGDMTVLICYYCGTAALVIGFAILIINNVKRSKRA